MLRVLLLLTAIACLSPVTAALAATFKIATLAPDGTKWMAEMRAGAEEIKQRTDGRVRFRFFPGGIMGNDQSVLRKIRVGQLHGGALTAGALGDIASDAQIYTLPLMFRSLAEVDYVRERMDSQIYDTLLENGFVSFGLSEGGFAYLMSNQPLQQAEDLKGQKVWIPEGDKISRAGFESLGVSPIPLPVADVLTGLQTGLIDTVGTSTTGAIALQWHSYIKYITEMPLLYLYGALVIERKRFEKISAADQDTVRQVMSAIFQRLNKQTREDNVEAQAALANEGIRFVTISAVDREVWEDKTKQDMDNLAEEGTFSQKILANVRRFISEYRQNN